MKRVVIMLIASTFSIAGILSYWGSTLVQRTLTEAEEMSMEVDCPSALFRIYFGSYDNSTKNLVLMLENRRSMDLRLEYLYIFYPNSVMREIPLNETLEGNKIKSLSFFGIDDGFVNGKIKTNCPDVSVEFAYDQVT